ncbi:MAG: type II toxin-antitoxin system VapC family toxin [bacterium]
MRLLLDTHIYLWVLGDDPKLSESARALICNAETVFVSGASIWEAAIKASLGKLDVDVDQLVSAIPESGFVELPVRAVHAAKVRTLPDLHHDPFDRLLIAQAILEPLWLVTSDKHLAGYSELVKAV